MYIKSVYKKEPVFSRSKLVFTIGENTFKEKLGTAFLKLSAISDGITKKEQDLYKDTTNSALFRVGASFAG
jgi:starch synthase